jgi:hypothetical protein
LANEQERLQADVELIGKRVRLTTKQTEALASIAATSGYAEEYITRFGDWLSEQMENFDFESMTETGWRMLREGAASVWEEVTGSQATKDVLEALRFIFSPGYALRKGWSLLEETGNDIYNWADKVGRDAIGAD